MAHKPRARAAPLRADLGPPVRYANRTAVLTYRPDPDAPSAPAIRAARAFIRYEHMGLDQPAFLAAQRVAEAAELCSGARERDGASVRSAAFWDRGGPTVAQVEGARNLRELGEVLGRHGAYCVVRVVVDGAPEHQDEARKGLATMAAWWGL